jgi:hypothetical protein
MAETTNINIQTFTVSEINTLVAALTALDGRQETVKDEKSGESKTKLVPYNFGVGGVGGGKLRYSIAKNLRILNDHKDDFTKARDNAILAISGGTGTIDDKDSEKIGLLNRELQDILQKEVPVQGLLKLPLADLNLDQNPELPASIVSLLLPLIAE